jgi:hypothetical protein
MKKYEKLPAIVVRGADLEPCTAEGCSEFATAFLVRTKKNVLTGEEKKSKEGYCNPHAQALHDQLLNNNANYQHESYEHPNKI